MQTFNSFNELANASVQPVQSQMSVFNAEFAGIDDLTLEQHKQCEAPMNAVLKAEKTFRAADDVFIQEEKQYKEELERIRQQVKSITAKRLAAANAFEKNKATLEAPLKPYGVTVAWDEPSRNEGMMTNTNPFLDGGHFPLLDETDDDLNIRSLIRGGYEVLYQKATGTKDDPNGYDAMVLKQGNTFRLAKHLADGSYDLLDYYKRYADAKRAADNL